MKLSKEYRVTLLLDGKMHKSLQQKADSLSLPVSTYIRTVLKQNLDGQKKSS